MKIITPVAITPSLLTSTNVLENDASAWAAGTYTLGQKVIYNHRVYEVIVSTTTAQPDVGAVAATPSWLDLGATNRYKMFDEIISTQTSRTGTIAVTITPGQAVNAVALFGLTGNSVAVSMVDPTDGTVYSQTRSLLDTTLIVDAWSYFFEPISYKSDTLFTNLPNYRSAAVSVTIDAGVATATCGELVIGSQRTLGVSNFGTSVSIQDYSIKDRDAFGNTIITQRAYSKRADYDVTVETAQIANVQLSLANIRTTPTVFVGDDNRPETLIYGFYRNFSIVISSPTLSDCSIEVEGLV